MLYIIATPIGNLKDITYRAVETLQSVSRIYAEDTRHTQKLLQHYGITTPLFAYHDHSSEAERAAIMRFLQEGNDAALVSDAGTPLIADPGYKLVAEAQAAGISVTSCPGANAAIAALSIAGVPTDQFHFHGFPPPKQQALHSYLASLAAEVTHVFYERISRVQAVIDGLKAQQATGTITIARELTKQYEEVLTAPIEQAVLPETAKGEVVLLIRLDAQQHTENPETLLQSLLQDHSVKDASHIAAELTGLPKKQLYQLALDLREG